MYQDLAAFYENPEVPNSFEGVEALHHSVKGKYSKKDVNHWLSQKDAYTLHKPVQHKFQRNRLFVSDIDRQFQAELVDMQSLAEFNKGYKYLLTCIDLFSKFAWAVPLKDKVGKSVKSGLEIIFKERKPKVLQTDAENKISHFKTQLPCPICLNGEWEVGLSEIIYPHSWLNVNDSSLYLENLGELLGFKRNVIIIGNMKSKFVADAWSNFSVFYVYSDLISPQIVGDIQAPLLRIVRTKGKDGETISQYYDRPQYLPLVRHSFQTIQSELRLNSGDFVPFERVKGGKTIGKEVLMTGSRVASDVLSGENFKEAVKTRSRESGKKLAQKVIDRVQSMVGKGQYKRKRKKQKKFISSKARKWWISESPSSRAQTGRTTILLIDLRVSPDPVCRMATILVPSVPGISSKGSPIKKCPGVRARISAGSLESGTRGLELMHASIWHNRVDSSSKLRRCPLQVLIRCLLANLIEDSQRPPKFGA
ncbi:uncharacterized transposon-derived protein F54H12.3 [Trichonephila clavipes]|nr:uncharacterized transposon-derived protein F54H12.3 [Trichonephila clavipes]